MSEESEAAVGGYDDGEAVPAGGAPVKTGAAGSAATASVDPTANIGAAATTTTPGPGPMLLPANPVFRFYKGGAGIDRFHGVEPGSGPGAPEDWVGSTTTSFGNDT
jgi:hypothetical protein